MTAPAAAVTWLPLVDAEAEEPFRVLRYVTGDAIPTDDRQFDDELVEGILGTAATAVMYGDSNAGKTFLVVDLAACVAAGLDWMGRPTRPGVVIYMAAESPGSVKLRVAAWRRRHPDADLAGLLIVESAINLHRDEADVDAMMQLVARVERTGRRVALIVVDTLARVAAGANENSGQDMAVILTRAEAVRTAAGCSLIFIHHSGKDAAKGARGWSGVRAAIDTEIEVTADDATGVRAAEITKQRDLSGKGDRIGFRLEPVTMGLNTWGTPRTSCTVVPTDAPARQAGKRMSEIAGAIAEALRQRGTGWNKRDLVKHLADRYEKASVYRELKKMTTAGRLSDLVGVVALVNEGAG